MRPTTRLSWPSSRNVSVSRVLGRRGFALENAAARVCREAGGRVTTNVLVQDMDLLPLRQVDNRRLEVVVDGLPLFRGAQLAIDTTMVSPVRSDGTARRQCAATSGGSFGPSQEAEKAHLPRTGSASRSRPVGGLGLRGGRTLVEETRQFLTGLAAAKARSEPKS